METRDYLANRAAVPTGTLTQLFFDAVDRFGDRVAFRGLREEGVQELTYRQVFEKVRAVALALEGAGLHRGDRIALLSDNRTEWSQTDYGALCAGMPLVPVHSTLTAAQAAYVIRDSGARIVFSSGSQALEKVRQAVKSCPDVNKVVCFDSPPEDADGVTGWEEFLEAGKREAEAVSEKAFRERSLLAEPHDCATILYTSGTTGDPKGVVLTHNNLYSNVRATTAAIPFDETDTTLSFLPLSHILQRMGDYIFFSSGSTIVYARSMKTIAEDLLTARPTKVIAPPRFYEKTYQKVMEQRGTKGLIVRWAREVGEAWTDEKLAGREPTWILRMVYRLAHSLVFRRIQEGLGGRTVFFISGSAPLAPEINKFFFSAGIRILEGYGLSETSPVATANTLEDFTIGTVGTPVPGTEIKIAEDGEILIRGPQVMLEYFNRPEETAKAITGDGWLITGDIGEIDEGGHLRITDRKKNLLVTTGGKNIAPAPIENRIKGNRYVDQVVMIGDQRHFPALLVVPAFDALEPWAAAAGIRAQSRKHLLKEPRVQEHIRMEVFGCLGDLASYETPKKLGLIEEEFTIEGGILTPNQKVKRRVVGERYGALIEKFYDPANRGRSVFVDGE